MKLERLESMCKKRALQAACPEGRLMDDLLKHHPEGVALKFRRVQFDVHESLKDRLESVCGLLDFSQREFLEAALLDSLDRAERTFFDTYHEATGCDFADDHGVSQDVILSVDEVRPC